jgi:hypothetical protein
MALVQQGTSNYAKILTIVQSQFTQRLSDGEEPAEGAVVSTRVLEKGPNAGKEVREIRASELTPSIITGAEFQETDYGNNLILKLVDESEDSFNLQIPIDSRFFAEFAKRIPNINLEKMVEFKIAKSKLDGKPYLFVSQDGEAVKFAFTKDNPGDMPQPVKKTVKGKVVWDWEEQENFLYELVVKFIDDLKTENGFETDIPF